MTETMTGLLKLEQRVGRSQLPSAAGRRRLGRGRLGHQHHGKRYLDFLSAYSALNFGHRHPSIAAAHASSTVSP